MEDTEEKTSNQEFGNQFLNRLLSYSQKKTH